LSVTILSHHILIILLGRCLFFVLTVTDQLLLSLLLHLIFLLLLHLLTLRIFLLILTLSLGLFFVNALLLLLLSALFSLLLLLSTSFLFGALSILFSGSLLLGLALGFHLLLLSSTIVFLLSGTFVAGSGSTSTKDLLHVRGGVNFSSGGLEHHLKESVSLLWFVTCNNFRWLNIKLFIDDELGQLDQLDQKVDLGVLLSDRLSVKLWSIKESSSEASSGHGGREDIVEVSEGGLGKQLLGHLRLLEDLSIHLSGWLPKFVSHFQYLFQLVFKFNYTI